MVTIGTDIDVFPLALGGNTFGWTSDENESRQVLDAFLAEGGNLIDTSDNYTSWVEGNSGGESETVIGGWLAARGNRDRVVIATKVSGHPRFPGLSAANIAAAVDASLGRLRTDYIDLYFAHFDDPDTPLAETAAAFDALVRAGKARAIGVSNYSGARIREWAEIARRDGLTAPVVVEPHYNLVKRADYERDVAPVAAAHRLAVLPYFALASGFLTGKYRSEADLTGARQPYAGAYFSPAGLAVVAVAEEIAAGHGVPPATVALAWLRGRPGVAAPVASARTLAQLPALMLPLELTAGERAALDEVSAAL
ncbi:aryl-alcohol dehydrogenase-like predicted oxidoreductase [Catenuloplanes nepalensis]|uniref:Aryl-alcohol dehydrogenase-like predicted oxidoreductase n=1 Tax=Catenuloplanes nepalensis TaxID=587533 RepID=A0ABT9MN22_9ACTN|nr:aldo/keto reductase [Catenuloplanes nepalensis]MDP9792848.1 aryl-alcohol dehydrogenase-like predicted oxidoreductase [Catenuloplanes nepalensis]